MQNDPNIKGASVKAEEEFKKQYPVVYSYLEGHKEKLSKRNKAETGIRYEWYALQRWGSNYSDEFNEQKIIYPCIMAQDSCFMFDQSAEYYTIAPGNIITGNDLKYLLSFLNSKIYYFALRKYYMGGGIEGELKTNRIMKLPIPSKKDIDFPLSNKLEELVNNVLIEARERDIINDNYLYMIDNIISSFLDLSAEELQYISEYPF